MSGALGWIQTSGLPGHYSGCSIGLSYERVFNERVRREQRLQDLAIHRLDADRHRLASVRLVDLDDERVLDAGRDQLRGELAQLGFVGDVKRDGVRTIGDFAFG